MKWRYLFKRQDLKKGIAFVLLAWFIFSIMYLVSKLIVDQTTIPTMLFFRNLVGLFIVIPWIVKYWPKSIYLNRPKIVIFRSFMGLFNLLFIFLAVKKISLVNTTLLNNSAPFFVPFILLFWKKIPLEWKIWPAIITGFIGIILILQPDSRIFDLGAFYALLSGICLALTIVTMHMTSRSEDAYSFILYFFVIGVVFTAPFAFLDWKVDNFLILLGLLSLGLCSVSGQYLLFNGLRYGQSQQLAPFTYATVIFSGIFEWIIWGITPTTIAWIGIVLIIASGIWIVLKSRPPKKV